MPQDDSQTPYGLTVYDNIQSILQKIQITFECLKLVFKTKTFARQPIHAHNIYASTIQIRDNIDFEIVIQFTKVSDRIYCSRTKLIRLFLFPLSKYLCKILFILIMLYMLHDLLLNVSQMGIEYITNSMGFMNTFNPAHTL